MLKKKHHSNIKSKPRKFWVRPIFEEENRLHQGASCNLLKELEDKDPEKFFNFLRMSPTTFRQLPSLLKLQLEKKHVIRLPIPPDTRLQITLRYLASGDSMTSISFLFRVGLNTVSTIIAETCLIIWDTLKDSVLKPPTQELWEEHAQSFERLWNFPHCVSAIDGKHVVIDAPPKSGSMYYNYKKSHSINLLATADANLRFILVDIGAPGRQSDSGIFQNLLIGKGLKAKTLNIPKPSIVNTTVLPYVLVGDEAFALSEYMMRPYPRSTDLNRRKKVFNYRLSRTRRVVESAFGILSGRWRIYRRPINASVATTIKIIKATVCLHNFLMTKDLTVNASQRHYSVEDCLEEQSTGIIDMCRTGCNTFSRKASDIREAFATYFEGVGSVPWQWEKVLRNDF